jgi:hypothetical protein
MNYAGSVADYTPAKLDAIKASIAKKSGVPAALITNLKAKSWYTQAMHRAARAGKKASVGSESTTILAGGGGVVLTFDMPKSKSAALIKAVKDGKVPMPHPRRDWPTSAPGLAHIRAGTGPHRRRDLRRCAGDEPRRLRGRLEIDQQSRDAGRTGRGCREEEGTLQCCLVQSWPGASCKANMSARMCSPFVPRLFARPRGRLVVCLRL